MDIDGRKLLVTGGTGSFGQAFTRFLLEHHRPARIVVFSRDELKQFEMQKQLQHKNLRYFIGDVRDYSRLRRALGGIDIVVHAAALKQVPIAEYNPIECIKTNVLGAENLINAALDCGVQQVVALSTDKAVNPINLYGAAKLCADKLFVAANNLSGREGTRFSIVRYGNVLGSRGSVLHHFREKAESGRLPITDERMTRFWITLEQGVSFVVRSVRMMQRGEIFVRKSPSMRIVDFARAIAPDCAFDSIGIRPGEKLHEIMVPAEEARHTFEFKDFYLIDNQTLHDKKDRPLVYEGQTGKAVEEGFSYASDTNTEWLDADALRRILGLAEASDTPAGL